MKKYDIEKISFIKSGDEATIAEGIRSTLDQITYYENRLRKAIRNYARFYEGIKISKDVEDEIMGLYIDTMMREERIFCPEAYAEGGDIYEIRSYLLHWTKYSVREYYQSIAREETIIGNSYYETSDLITGIDFVDIMDKGLEVQNRMKSSLFEKVIRALKYGGLIEEYLGKETDIEHNYKYSLRREDKKLLKEQDNSDTRELMLVVKDIIALYLQDNDVLDKAIDYINEVESAYKKDIVTKRLAYLESVVGLNFRDKKEVIRLIRGCRGCGGHEMPSKYTDCNDIIVNTFEHVINEVAV